MPVFELQGYTKMRLSFRAIFLIILLNIVAISEGEAYQRENFKTVGSDIFLAQLIPWGFNMRGRLAVLEYSGQVSVVDERTNRQHAGFISLGFVCDIQPETTRLEISIAASSSLFSNLTFIDKEENENLSLYIIEVYSDDGFSDSDIFKDAGFFERYVRDMDHYPYLNMRFRGRPLPDMLVFRHEIPSMYLADQRSEKEIAAYMFTTSIMSEMVISALAGSNSLVSFSFHTPNRQPIFTIYIDAQGASAAAERFWQRCGRDSLILPPRF